MDKKTIFIVILLILLGITTGLGIYFYLHQAKPVEIPVALIPDNTKELEQIDSLNSIISTKNEEIAKLREEVSKRKVVVINEVEEIKQLPFDENVVLMHENLVKYGELTQEDDSLSKKIRITGEDLQIDSAVIISENNMKDVNIIAAKYSGELEINEYLNKEIELDSVILSKKDSILLQNSIMFEKQETIYNINMESLQKSLEQEQVQKKKLAWILGGTAAVSLTITGVLIAVAASK